MFAPLHLWFQYLLSFLGQFPTLEPGAQIPTPSPAAKPCRAPCWSCPSIRVVGQAKHRLSPWEVSHLHTAHLVPPHDTMGGHFPPQRNGRTTTGPSLVGFIHQNGGSISTFYMQRRLCPDQPITPLVILKVNWKQDFLTNVAAALSTRLHNEFNNNRGYDLHEITDRDGQVLSISLWCGAPLSNGLQLLKALAIQFLICGCT